MTMVTIIDDNNVDNNDYNSDWKKETKVPSRWKDGEGRCRKR